MQNHFIYWENKVSNVGGHTKLRDGKQPAMVVHAFNPSTQEAEAGVQRGYEFKASLVYKASSGQPGLLHRETLSGGGREELTNKADI